MGKYIKKIVCCILFCCICILPPCLTSAYGADAEDGKRVLYISSYTVAWDPTVQQIEGIRSALGSDVVLDYKFMDTKNLRSEKSQEFFFESITAYLDEVLPYDVIIAGDDAAYSFVMEHRNTVFTGIPVVFLGVNDMELAHKADSLEDVTGIAECLSYSDTIRLSGVLFPQATQIVAILDDTVTGQIERETFYSQQNDFPEFSFREINASSLSKEELCDEVASLGSESILFYVMCTMDKDHNAYTSAQSVALVSESASVPVFGIISIGMGDGILGGEMISHERMGYQAGHMAERILNGTSPAAIKVVYTPPRTWTFDEEVMKTYGITARQLPEGTEIINHEESFWERNGEIVRVAGTIGILLVAMLAFLLVDNWKKRKTNEGLNETLEDTARHDVLTKLLNRSAFMEDLQKQVREDRAFGLIFFDIDNFKHINDTFGHNCGDDVLKIIASRAEVRCDENMQVYRLAGDEFTAIVDSMDEEIVHVYALAVQGIFTKPFRLKEGNLGIHGSMGVAMYPRDGATAPDLIAAADAAMYEVKNNGKGGIAFSGQEEIVR